MSYADIAKDTTVRDDERAVRRWVRNMQSYGTAAPLSRIRRGEDNGNFLLGVVERLFTRVFLIWYGRIIHTHGGQVYMDGANMNALMG
ncbi:hypothetical protein GPECTOR_461g368 [Gonium pectorale]|uniref:Uncharacterized protein n=1 Tax=Gonium pectorale TaxID=33097 RepID=A0A150FV06_GONPE|nr:hypothetical protein GPECTOR_461g368 [Gonium pectorale]|eukprot:KXZ41451.1 hypothetical protein GPECTOR_461g368 [Gonium pectorale]